MEIEINCCRKQVIQDTPEQPICQGYFTFVALDADGHAQSMPPFEPETDAEKANWKAAGARPEIRVRESD